MQELTTQEWIHDIFAGDLIAFVQKATFGENVYTMAPDGSRMRLRTVERAWGGGFNPAWIRR